MNKFIIIILMAIMLSGCFPEKKIVYVDRIKEIPVIIHAPAPDLPVVEELVDLPIYHLTPGSTAEDVARAFVQTVEILKNKITQYQEALSSTDPE